MLLLLPALATAACQSLPSITYAGSANINATSDSEYCWMWEGGERFFVVFPYRTDGTLIKLYGGARGGLSELIPDATLAAQNPPYITTISKSVVKAVAQMKAGSKLFGSAVNIPITSCVRGIDFTTKVKDSWQATHSSKCLIAVPGARFRYRLTQVLTSGYDINVYTTTFRKPDRVLGADTEWSELVGPPVVFETSGGNGVYPAIEIRVEEGAEFPVDGRIEVSGIVQGPNAMTGVAMVCVLVAVISIAIIMAGTYDCFRTWTKHVGSYKTISQARGV